MRPRRMRCLAAARLTSWISAIPAAVQSSTSWRITAGIAEIHEVSLAAAKQRIRRGRMMLVDELAAHAQRHADLKGVPMRCWAAREKVSDYLDGDLTPPERNALELHLGGCPTCPPLYAGLVGVRNGLERLRDPDTVIAPALADRLRSLRTGV